ncbi:hypothetical protein OIU77_018199 [Salix suchowensis]|uniref:Uncharacterized protein n=1 Tax=Salix suchowensis TaxID=1278906 RepID=A0ABQ8ZRD6_9ROSI|nr:hypothetical protein OIU77_018199 [Salix suchowensis]
MKKKQLVFVPVPGVGHLVSAVQLAKTILERDDSFLITMLAISNPFAGSMNKHTESLASMHPEIRFIDIPEAVTAPPSEALAASPAGAFTSYVIDHKTLVRDIIVKLVMADNPAPIASVVVDMFCTAFIDVARELGVPSHVFFTSGAAFLALTLYLSDREDRGEPKFIPTDPDYTIPCFSNPVPYRVLPLLHSGVDYEVFANHGRKFKDSNGIIVNTFSEAESHTVSALLARDDIPPVFNVGPLIDHKGKSVSGSDAVKHFVKAEEITKAVKSMMEQGGELRNKAKEISEMAKKAVIEGGSAYVAFGDLIDQWLESKP